MDFNNLNKQHKKGKLHAMERINAILDDNSFTKLNSIGEDCQGVIAGYGTVCGEKVYIYSQDFTVNGGTINRKNAREIVNVFKHAINEKKIIIGINDSGGAQIQDGVNALAGYGEILYYNTLASGYIPQIMIIAGPCAGGAVYSPGISDFIYIIENIGHMFVTGPHVIKNLTGEDCNENSFGGSEMHTKESGVAHFACKSESDCFSHVRDLCAILYYAINKKVKKISCTKREGNSLKNYIPLDGRKVYDIRPIIVSILDTNNFIEVHQNYATNAIVGFGLIAGNAVGIVGNQPLCMGGVLDISASVKIARFVRFCDAYDIPLVTLVDVPGFLPGLNQEKKGIIRHGAKMLYAYAEATIPQITIILRKAYGGAYIAMGSKHLGSSRVYALKNAEIAVMGESGAIPIIYKSQLKRIEDTDEREQFIETKKEEYRIKYLNIDLAVKEGYIDEVIGIDDIRDKIICDLGTVGYVNEKKINKKHGCMPL